MFYASVCLLPWTAPSAALAQDPGAVADPSAGAASEPADANSNSADSTIVVTGSRVARSGFTAPTPTTVLGLDEINASAPTNLADLVNSLPAVRATLTPASASNNSNFGDRKSTRLNSRH